jgi:hypothetical protein
MQHARKPRRARKVHWQRVAMPNVPIAGPRRLRPTTLPQEPSVEVAAVRAENAPTTSYSRPVAAPAAPAAPGSTRALPPLDYDDTGRGRRPKELEATQPGRRRRSNRVLWFVLGIAFGATAAVFARGDAMGTFHAARAWGASTLRSLEHKPSPATSAGSSPYSMATAADSQVPAAVKDGPCSVDPGPDDPCAELLAPFVTNIPTVSVDDLPAVKDDAPAVASMAPVVVIARRHVRRPAPVASRPHVAAAEESAETEPLPPVGINPDEDEPQARPTKVVPTSAPPAERPVPAPPVEEKSAKNEAT